MMQVFQRSLRSNVFRTFQASLRTYFTKQIWNESAVYKVYEGTDKQVAVDWMMT